MWLVVITWLPCCTWWCQKGDWEGGCACLPGLGMTLSPLSTWCACWGLVTWCSHIVLVVMSHVGVVVGVSDNRCCVLSCVISVVVAWWVLIVLDGSGWMGCIVNGNGGKEEVMWLCLSQSCHIWEDMCQRWDIFCFCFTYNKAKNITLGKE